MLLYDGVTKRFGRVTALESLDLEVERGEVLGLLGPNGAGKTTAVRLASGQLSPDAGRVSLDGAGPPDAPAARAALGVAPQSLALYEPLTGRENLAFVGRLYGLHGGELRARVDEALDFVGLTDRAGDRVSAYSGGMKRRLNLAAALVHEPELLLLDEPTVGVDPQSRNAIFDNILALRDRGCTIVYTTHYMEEAQRLCDRVAILDQGRLLALDTVRALVGQYGGRDVVVATLTEGTQRLETGDPIAELARLQQGGQLLRFSVERPDLESVFLELTGRHLRD